MKILASYEPVPFPEFTLEGLAPSLHQYVIWEGKFGPWFDHPLYRAMGLPALAGLPADPSTNRAGGLALINQVIDEKQSSLAKARSKKDWLTYIFLHHRPYRVDALIHVMNVTPPSKAWDLVRDVWIDSESNMQSEEEWNWIWSFAYNKRGNFTKFHPRVMSAKDRAAYDELPDTVTIYRGCRSETEIRAYSWTLDRQKAEWFARRSKFNGQAIVAKVDIPKVFLIAYFSNRDESEVVLNYLSCDLDLLDVEVQELEPRAIHP